MTEKIETYPKATKFEFGDKVRITKYKNVFSKCYTNNWSREMFLIGSVLKTNPWIINELLSRTKVDDLGVGKFKTVWGDLKKLSDEVSKGKEVVKKIVHKILNTKVNNLENKIPDVFALIQTNQYNIYKLNLEERK